MINSISNTTVSFSAALMAGGKSTRMGRDKCLLEIPETQGLPLWRHQLITLGSLGAEAVWISGRPEQTYFPPASLITDIWEDTGPLGGIASVLSRVSTPLLVVLGVDLPGITTTILRTLLEACQQDQGAVFRGAEFYETLAAVYPQTMLASAEAMLAQGNFRLQAWVQQGVNQGHMKALSLPPEWLAAFRNINTPSD